MSGPNYLTKISTTTKNTYEWEKYIRILGLFWIMQFHMGDF